MTQSAILTASDGEDADEFGASVALSGNTVTVGAPFHDGTGAAYVFVEPATGWTDMSETAELSASDETSGEYFFGVSVATTGQTVIVGAPGTGSSMNPLLGAAYIYAKPKGGWTTTSTFNAQLASSDEALNDFFGFSVAVGSSTAAIGAPHTAGSNTSQGTAYVFGP
jgi:hypothetical protein